MAETDKPLAGRLAVVTGASRGIGREIAIQLAEKGCHIVALAKTQGGLEELDDAVRAAGSSATLVPLDIKDFDALDRLGASIHERWGKLDVFVGNAGILGPISPLGHVPPKLWDDVMAVNVTANWRLIRSLDPLLRESDAGRVVLISSGAAHKARAYWGPYSVSKAALEVLGRTYAAETQTTPIRLTLVNPGPIRTRMRAQAMPGEDASTLDTPDMVAAKILPFCLPAHDGPVALYDYPQDRLLGFPMPA